MDYSSTVATPWPTKTLRTEQDAQAWGSSLQWETSIPVCNQRRGSNSLSVSASIPGSALLGRWAVQSVRNSSPGVKRQTLPPAYKDWLRPLPWPSVTRHIACYRDMLPVKREENRHFVVGLGWSLCITSSRTVDRGGDSLFRRRE